MPLCEMSPEESYDLLYKFIDCQVTTPVCLIFLSSGCICDVNKVIVEQ